MNYNYTHDTCKERLQRMIQSLNSELNELENIPSKYGIDKNTHRKAILKEFHEKWLALYKTELHKDST